MLIRRAVSVGASLAAAASFIAVPAQAGRAQQGGISSSVAAAPDGLQRAVVQKYCTTCHSDRLKTAGLTLQSVDPDHVDANPELWEKVVKKLRGGSMPPVIAPRPDKGTIAALIGHLESGLDRAAARSPNPGWTAIHRLNRAEYANVIRDVLQLNVDVATLLPVDDAAFGFDNIATLLSMSPGLLDRYLSAARKVSLLAIPDAGMPPEFEVHDISKFLVQNERMSEDLPFGSAGGVAIPHDFPLSAEYIVKVVVSGRNPVDIRLDGKLLGVITPTRDATGGNTSMAPAQELRFKADAGQHVVGLSFLDKSVVAEGIAPDRPPARGRPNPGVNRVEIGGPFNVSSVSATPTRRAIFVCRPASAREEPPCARKIFDGLAGRLYRRPTTPEDVKTLMEFYSASRADGDGFEAGIRRGLVRLLVSPDFLFRIERDPENGTAAPHRISDLELASRLSFFLWSSAPDEELLHIAARGALHEPVTLGQQVKRMLKDERAGALVTNFASQWLYLRNLRTVTPDPLLFPEFDENLRNAMRRETELYVGSQIDEDRPLLDLLRSNYTFVNERLARHYGIPGVYGSGFRKITATDDRQGLLGHASILTVTSYAHRTSVVQRGKWILENLLGATTPAPPPDIPPLEENTADKPPRSLRERMVQHRQNPMCSVCHAAMDPVGFSLENFDAVGEWRTTDAGVPIDASGALPDGTKLNGPGDLRKAILDRRDQFVRVTTEKLLTYALGRGVEYYDQPAIRQILREAAPSDYRWSALMLAIVKSAPFRMRLPATTTTSPDASPAVQ